MYVFTEKDKGITAVVIILACFLSGVYFAKFYQPQNKTKGIYKQALKDYQNGNYSNAYYLFSKVSKTSKLKPVAIYRQALCAKALGDKDSELRQYQTLFQSYPNSKLSMEAKYQAGQILLDENPRLAQKYFNSVAGADVPEDYKIASNYYKAKITASKLRYSGKVLSRSKMKEIETPFRDYLEKYSDGRLAVNVANNWTKFNPNLKPKDAVLIARAYYLAGLASDAEKVLEKVNVKNSWAVRASLAAKKNDQEKVNSLVEEGVSKYSEYADRADYKRAIDDYLKLNKPSRTAIFGLFENAKGNGKDYIWNLKCEHSPSSEKYSCYKDLYITYPKSEYSPTALEKMMLDRIKAKDYANARALGKQFISKYPDSEYIPEILFWVGKMELRYNSLENVRYFQEVINKYPDSYYAYRSFWILKSLGSAVIPANLDYKPVVYPYRYPSQNDILFHLMLVNDYEMMSKLTKDDFIKSWVEYEKGNYAVSAHLAQDAMAKMTVKPVKSDLRWRLVYPQNYYRQVKNSAAEYKNNDALMMAIIREESFFNSEAQSGVGAIGLMQLMPATAHDIGAKSGISFNTSHLFNPELNIKIGNLYYSTIRGMLENKDVSAIAAYNGGIGSVTRWKSTLKYSDTDEFVEQIPYDETKNYVKKVFRSYWNYTRIYQK
ncbi:transglycosylase SLT domain-containing protein [bacterium]|nr:transglycosylase SLT domain-containing protein [bacterium]